MFLLFVFTEEERKDNQHNKSMWLNGRLTVIWMFDDVKTKCLQMILTLVAQFLKWFRQ